VVVTTAERARDLAKRLYGKASLGPGDVDFAQIYDHFTGCVLMELEDYDFCKRGEGGPPVRGRSALPSTRKWTTSNSESGRFGACDDTQADDCAPAAARSRRCGFGREAQEPRRSGRARDT
jgi:hypothetical protein